jgi:rhodanese-related sulfurtransferase
MKAKSLALLIPLLAVPAMAAAAHADIEQQSIEDFLGSVPNNMMYLISPADLAEGMENMPDDWVILDIRPPAHYNNGHIQGAMNIPLPYLIAEMEKIPNGKKVAVVCAMDTNSAFAVAILQMLGYDAWIVEGGVPGWVKMGMSLEK